MTWNDMEYILSNTTCIVSAFCLLFLNSIFSKHCRKLILRRSTNSFFIDLVFSLFALRILLYYVLPSISRVIIGWDNQKQENVQPFEVSIVYLVELISHLIYYYTFYWLCKRTKYDYSFVNQNSSSLKVIVISILLLYACFLVHGTGIIVIPFCDSLWMIQPFVMSTGSVACFYFLAIGRKLSGKWVLVVSCIVIIIYILTGLASGIRGKLFWPVFWMLFCAYHINRKRIKMMFYLGGGILLVLLIMQGGMTATRGAKEMNIVEMIQLINDSKNEGGKSLFSEIDYRFGALTNYSVGFYRMVDRNDMAGMNPIINSLYSPLPRVFFEKKPVPCSADGDLYSMGMYKTVAEITNIDTNMCEFSTAAHAYWELHLLGVVLFSIIPAFYVFCSIRLFRNFAILAPPLLCSVFKPWGYNDPKIWVSEIVLQLSQIIIPTLVLYFVYRKFFKSCSY